MVRDDILGGLKSALVRGYSLKDAMISFYNAGYTKDEIEEAAKKLQYEMMENREFRDLVQNPGRIQAPAKAIAVQKGVSPSVVSPAPGHVEETATEKLPETEKEERAQSFRPLHTHAERGMPRQRRAAVYQPGNSIRVITIVLVVLLLLLLGMLGAVFIFKNQIIQFFNNLLK